VKELDLEGITARLRKLDEYTAKAEIVSHDLAERLEGAGGFRSFLVHDYLDIDRHIVYRTLQDDLDDIRDFAAAVAKFVTETLANEREGI